VAEKQISIDIIYGVTSNLRKIFSNFKCSMCMFDVYHCVFTCHIVQYSVFQLDCGLFLRRS